MVGTCIKKHEIDPNKSNNTIMDANAVKYGTSSDTNEGTETKKASGKRAASSAVASA